MVINQLLGPSQKSGPLSIWRGLHCTSLYLLHLWLFLFHWNMSKSHILYTYTIINAWKPNWAQLESCGKGKAPPAHWRHDLGLLLRTAWTRATTWAIVVPQKEGSGCTDPLLTGGRFFRRKYLGAQSNTQVQQKALQGLGFPVLTSLGLLPPNPSNKRAKHSQPQLQSASKKLSGFLLVKKLCKEEEEDLWDTFQNQNAQQCNSTNSVSCQSSACWSHQHLDVLVLRAATVCRML